MNSEQQAILSEATTRQAAMPVDQTNAKVEKARRDKQAAKRVRHDPGSMEWVKAPKRSRKPSAASAVRVAKATKPDKVEGQTRLYPKLDRYTVSKDVKTASGRPSIHNGDPIAKLLLGKSLDETFALGARLLPNYTETTLREEYAHLNVGMQRMNVGNRLRAMLKKHPEKFADGGVTVKVKRTSKGSAKPQATVKAPVEQPAVVC